MLIYGILLLIVIVAMPGGIVGAVKNIKAGILRRRAQKLDKECSEMLKTDGVTIRFGGLVAVNKVSIHVRKGQITVSSG